MLRLYQWSTCRRKKYDISGYKGDIISIGSNYKQSDQQSDREEKRVNVKSNTLRSRLGAFFLAGVLLAGSQNAMSTCNNAVSCLSKKDAAIFLLMALPLLPVVLVTDSIEKTGKKIKELNKTVEGRSALKRAKKELGKNDEICLIACGRYDTDNKWLTSDGKSMRRVAAENILARPLGAQPTPKQQALRFIALIKTTYALMEDTKELPKAFAYFNEAVELGQSEAMWRYIEKSHEEREAYHQKREKLTDNFTDYGDRHYFEEMLHSFYYMLEWNRNLEEKTGEVNYALNCKAGAVTEKIEAYTSVDYSRRNHHYSKESISSRIDADKYAARSCARIREITATTRHIPGEDTPQSIETYQAPPAAETRVPITDNFDIVQVVDDPSGDFQFDDLRANVLRIVNCHYDSIVVRNGHIGRVEIIGTRFGVLDISDTQADSWKIENPEKGTIIHQRSNYVPEKQK
jgi:hypothetical protein